MWYCLYRNITMTTPEGKAFLEFQRDLVDVIAKMLRDRYSTTDRWAEGMKRDIDHGVYDKNVDALVAEFLKLKNDPEFPMLDVLVRFLQLAVRQAAVKYREEISSNQESPLNEKT